LRGISLRQSAHSSASPLLAVQSVHACGSAVRNSDRQNLCTSRATLAQPLRSLSNFAAPKIDSMR
jgi:hypothetical protein